MGGSYGGYATLAGLTFTPDTFACGVDIVGPSNLYAARRRSRRTGSRSSSMFYAARGRPDAPTRARSCSSSARRSPARTEIKRPLLIGQGANDPRVKQAESDQIVDAMKAKEDPVTYVLFPDEGHGFARPENNIAFTAITEDFLARALAGAPTYRRRGQGVYRRGA